ncbi:HAMP domain-containing sensor histidine kinase [Paenibacillus sp. LHD-38]|uniref:sensor histidine kinase n=1 Tax=Paenibacillus sp. LHD-38 TaxID=3072143 RepID=UPI00280F31D6|nr:HAMP domain-containing sensor histidine kinase [Paenibacillus sp. LHD-38]MDQ8733796.1 HAMP domain-containing sensor histidine kinase [Paenibacillus sp. LHD-38]
MRSGSHAGFSRREKRSLVLISAGAALLTLACSLWLSFCADRAEQEKLALFWNGYAKLFYEKTGSWTGFEERLQSDRYMVDSNKSLILRAYGLDGKSAIAGWNANKNDNLQARKIAILSNGKIVGYTQAMVETPKSAAIRIVIPPLVSLLLAYVIGAWAIRRSQREARQTEQRIAAAIAERADLTGEKHAYHREDSLNRVLEQVDQLARRVERLETVRRTMVADIAHELRTPIAVMRAQLDHAIQEGKPLPLERIVPLHDETLRLTKHVRDLQELSLAESGHLPLSKSWFSLSKLTADVAETLAVGTEEKDIHTSIAMDQDIRVYADEARVRQIIINLLGNGLQHARDELRIELRLKDGQAELTIADDGLGIEAEELAFVFERFYRGGDQLKASKRGVGLGLGLAIAKQFTLAHGGRLSVSSQYGAGAAFTLCLPIIEG